MFMIKEFPHYSDASIRQTLKYIRGKMGYRGEALWWHLLEWLNQHDAEPIDLNDPLMLFSTCEYVHPLEADCDKREEEVLVFLDFCSKFQGRDGETLIDPSLWSEKKIWSLKNYENQQKILKRRKGSEKVPAPPEITEFTKQMHKDITTVFGSRKGIKWNYTWDDNLLSLLKDPDITLDDARFVWNWLVTVNNKDTAFWRRPMQSANAFKKHFAKIYPLANAHKSQPIRKSIFA